MRYLPTYYGDRTQDLACTLVPVRAGLLSNRPERLESRVWEADLRGDIDGAAVCAVPDRVQVLSRGMRLESRCSEAELGVGQG